LKDILKLCVSLGIICFIAGSLLVFVKTKTDGPIQLAKQNTLQKKLSLVLPKETAKTGDPEKLDDISFYPAFDASNHQIAWVAEATTSKGFGGKIKILTGLSLQGEILGIVVVEHNETPGIGSQAAERKQQKSLWKTLAGKSVANPFPPNSYLDSYAGKKLSNGAFIPTSGNANSITTISGATISSKAIMDAVNKIQKTWQKNSEHLQSLITK